MRKGIIHISIATICFSFVNIFAKLLSAPSALMPDLQVYPVHELVFFRSFFSLIICYVYLKFYRLPILGNNRKWLLVRGIFGTISLTLFFYTLKELPLVVAVTIQYLSPILTVILALFLFKEKVGVMQFVYFFIALGGIVFLMLGENKDVSIQAISPLWILVGIGSAVGSAIAYNAIQKCKDTDHPMNIVFYFPFVATPLMFVLCCFNAVIPQGIEWLFLLLMGIFTQFAQLFMTKALHEGGIVKITPFNYIGAIYAFFIGLFLFNEYITWEALFGMLLICFGVLANTFYKALKQDKTA